MSGSDSGQPSILSRFLTTDRLAEDAGLTAPVEGNAPADRVERFGRITFTSDAQRQQYWCSLRFCMVIGMLVFTFSVFWLFLDEGNGFHVEQVTDNLLKHTRQVSCSRKGSEIEVDSRSVYLGPCKATAKDPVSLEVPGFQEVLRKNSDKRAIWTEMIIEHNSRRRHGWDIVSQEGSLKAWSNRAKDVSFGPYKLSSSAIRLIPGDWLELELTSWQKEGRPQPRVEQDWQNWTFNETTMAVDSKSNYIWAGDTRVHFVGGFEGKYSAVGEVSKQQGVGDVLSAVSTSDNWVKRIFLMERGSVSFHELTDHYAQEQTDKLWADRFTDGYLLCIGLWGGLWPASALACCVNVFTRMSNLPGCCDWYGFTTCARAILLGIIVTFIVSYGSWLYFHNGSVVSVSVMSGMFGMFLLIAITPRIAASLRSWQLATVGEPVQVHSTQLTPTPQSPPSAQDSESGGGQEGPLDSSSVSSFMTACLAFVAFVVVAVLANIALSSQMQGAVKLDS